MVPANTTERALIVVRWLEVPRRKSCLCLPLFPPLCPEATREVSCTFKSSSDCSVACVVRQSHTGVCMWWWQGDVFPAISLLEHCG